MALSSISTSPPPITAQRWPRAAAWSSAAIVLVVGGLAYVLGVSIAVLVGVPIAIGFAFVAVWIFQFNRTDAPTRLIPNGMSSAFSKRLSGKSMIVGRTPCCDISLPLPTVSGHHCRLFRKGSAWYIEDLASSNGTFVNDRRIRKRRISIGDKIRVGEIEFEVG